MQYSWSVSKFIKYLIMSTVMCCSIVKRRASFGRGHRNQMMKGMSSFGKCHNKSHTLCHCSGCKACHLQNPAGGKCGYQSKWKRTYHWSAKTTRGYTTGNIQMNHLQIVYCRFQHGFCDVTTPSRRRATGTASSSS